jgi:hypothetical protein
MGKKRKMAKLVRARGSTCVPGAMLQAPAQTGPLAVEFAGGVALDSYDALVAAVAARIRAGQVRASLAVNNELVLMNWELGNYIRHAQHCWKGYIRSLDLWPVVSCGRLAICFGKQFLDGMS